MSPLGVAARSAAFSPDGELLAVGLKSGAFVVLKTADLKVVAQKRDRHQAIQDVRYTNKSSTYYVRVNLQRIFSLVLSCYIRRYNILTTRYFNCWQSDWFPTWGIWDNVPLPPYLGSPLITNLGHVHVHTCIVMLFKIINIPFLFVPSFFPR